MDNIFDTLAVISTVGLNLYAFAHIVAVVFTWIDADPNNGMVVFINRITHPLWLWVERFLPLMWKSLSAFFAILLVYWLRQFVPNAITELGQFALGSAELPALTISILKLGLVATLSVARSLLFFIMILCAAWFVITLISAPLNNPVVRTVYILVSPIIEPFRKFLPRAKIDLSPLVAAFFVWLGSRFLAYLQEGIQFNSFF